MDKRVDCCIRYKGFGEQPKINFHLFTHLLSVFPYYYFVVFAFGFYWHIFLG